MLALAISRSSLIAFQYSTSAAKVYFFTNFSVLKALLDQPEEKQKKTTTKVNPQGFYF